MTGSFSVVEEVSAYLEVAQMVRLRRPVPLGTLQRHFGDDSC